MSREVAIGICSGRTPGGDPQTSNGSYDVFLSKFDSSGDFVWALTWGGISHDEGFGVATDHIGNAYISGDFSRTVDFTPTDPSCNNSPDVRTAIGIRDVFLAKHLWDGCW